MIDSPNEITVYTFIIICFYLVAMRNIWVIVSEKMNSSAALTWILVNISFPFIGVPLFFFLGQNRLKHYRKRREKRVMSPNKELFRSSTHNDLRLITTGPEAFSLIKNEIRHAKQSIILQYYIFRTDSLGLNIIELLIEKAREGVQVFFLYDNLGSFSLTGKHSRRMKAAGVHVENFLPFSFRFNLQINFRNHRKMVLVDGKCCFLGGMNVGEEYLGKRRHWRDTQVQIKGPACHEIMDTFCEDWTFAASKKNLEALKKLRQSDEKAGSGKFPLQVFSYGPGDELHRGLFMFMDLLSKAEESITIATPYYIPDHVLQKVLELAVLKGIEVKLIIPAKSDSLAVQLINQFNVKHAARRGAMVHLYEPGFMHQKVILVDEQFALLGTSNFDNRSIYLNFETSIVVEDHSFAVQVKEMLDKDLKNCRLLTVSEDKLAHRLAEKIMRLAAPLF